MLIDACLFAAEEDMLALRLQTIGTAIDRAVVVACTTTHQGRPADRDQITEAFANARERASRAGAIAALHVSLHWVEPSRYLKRGGRIMERSADERGPAGSPWFMHIEHQHRDGMRAAVETVATSRDDVIALSDVDEIPNPDALLKAAALLRADPTPIVLEMRFHSTALDLLHPQGMWFGTTVSTLGACRPQEQRDARTTIGTDHQSVIVLPDSGAHLSWYGTDEQRQRKLETFSHSELAMRGADPREWRRLGVHANPGETLRRLSIEESYALWFPKPLLDGSFPIPDGWLSEDCWETK